MAEHDEEHTYVFSVSDFDKSLLPTHARIPGTDDFREEVSKFIQKDFAEFGGRVRIVVSNETIQVVWSRDPKRPDPMQVVVGKLQRGEFAEAVLILELFRQKRPDDFHVLYNLGMGLSDMGQMGRAEAHRRHALEVAPENVDAMIALGVALVRQERNDEATDQFRAAVAVEPENPLALRNLGACLLQDGQIDEALPLLRSAYEKTPQDQQAVFGYAQALHVSGNPAEADALYAKVIALDERSKTAEAAKRERSKLAEFSFRSSVPIGVRRDGVMYCIGALKQFSGMPEAEVERIGFEIALLGRSGIDANDPNKQYTLKSLPGQYSGVQLLCLMFVAFKQITPDKSIGFDLSAEYDIAKKMWEEKMGQEG